MRPSLFLKKNSISEFALIMFMLEKRIIDACDIYAAVNEGHYPLLIDQGLQIKKLEIIILYLNERYFFPEMFSEKHQNIILLRSFLRMLTNDYPGTLGRIEDVMANYPTDFLMSDTITILDCVYTANIIYQDKLTKQQKNYISKIKKIDSYNKTFDFLKKSNNLK